MTNSVNNREPLDRHIIENLTYPLIVVDEDLNILQLNIEARDKLSEFVVGEKFKCDTLYGSSVERENCVICNTIKEKKPLSDEILNGEVICRVKTDFIEDEIKNIVVIHIENIDYLKEAMSYERDIQAIFNNVDVLLWSVYEGDDGYLYYDRVNEYFASIAGKIPEDYFGKRVIDLGKGHEAIRKRYEDLKITKEIQTYEKSVDDGNKEFIIRLIPIVNSHGEVFRFIGAAVEITELKKNEQIQSVLYNIANAVNTNENLNGFFESIHHQLNRIIDATNIYIALYDDETDSFKFAYSNIVDEEVNMKSFPASKSITDYMIKREEPLLLKESDLDALVKSGEVELIGKKTKNWLGIPLKIGGKITGTLSFLNYNDKDAYSEKDVKVLEIVSKQIASAIEEVKAEEVLRESEERYRILYEDNPSMYFTVDGEGTVLSVNDFGARQLGYTKDELLGESVLKVFHPDDKDDVSEQLKYCLSNPGELLNWEFRKVRKDGEVIWVEEFARATLDIDGELIALIVCDDITERKEVNDMIERSLLVEETISNILTRFVDISNIEEDIDKSMVDIGHLCNASSVQLFIISDDSITLSLRHEWSAQEMKPMIDELQGIPTEMLPWTLVRLYKGESVQVDKLNEMTKKATVDKEFYEGMNIHSFISLPIKLENKLIGFIQFSNDMPDVECDPEELAIMQFFAKIIENAYQRKDTKNSLYESEERLKAIVESINYAFLICTKYGDINFWNTSALNLFGYYEDEIINIKLEDVIKFKSYQEAFYDGLRKIGETKRWFFLDKTIEVVGKTINGEEFPIEITIKQAEIAKVPSVILYIKEILPFEKD